MEPEGYSIEEMEKATGTSARTIRQWIRAGLLAAPVARGPVTRYAPEQYLRARAIAALRGKNVKLAEIRRRLKSATSADLEALLAPAVAVQAAPVVPPEPPNVTYPARVWEHVELFPGVELRVAKDAGPLGQRIAQSIWEHYGAKQR